MRRIAKGLKKFVIDSPDPFIVQVNHAGKNFRGQGLDKPLSTVTAKHGYGLVTPYLSQIGQQKFAGDGRSHDLRDPLSTIVTKAEHLLVAPTLIQYHGEQSDKEVRGQAVDKPLLTADSSNRYGLVTAWMMHYYGTSIGGGMGEPLGTITALGQHIAEVQAFLVKYYGQGEGQGVNEPLHTITTKDRFGLVTVKGVDYQIIDIGMRMLTPRELFNAQGFPADYVIEKDADGNTYPKTAQVARCGNAVPPPFAEALVKINLPEKCDVAAVG